MSQSANRRILVVDDEDDVRDMVEKLLTRAGHTVDTSGDPSDIVASLLVGRYDLITVDLKMPEIDGQDIAQLARTVDRRIPIVVISGFLTHELRQRLEGMGIRHFVEKPFKPDELVSIVGDALSGTSQSPA